MDRTTRRLTAAAILMILALLPTIPWCIGRTSADSGSAVIAEGMGLCFTWADLWDRRSGFDPQPGFHIVDRQYRWQRPLLLYRISLDRAALEFSFPLWPVPLAMLAAAWIRTYRRGRRGRAGACAGCGYRPEALVARCPECGRPTSALECIALPSCMATLKPTSPPVTITRARSEPEVAAFRALCLEYAKSLEYTGECKSLESQCFDTEMATLPGLYGQPRGEILVAFDGAEPVGCVALRPLSDTICEMKRMYTRSSHRGRGVGRLLATSIIAAARERGYAAMRLDTGASMKHAAALYRSLGFREIPAYNRDPVPGTVWMELTLL